MSKKAKWWILTKERADIKLAIEKLIEAEADPDVLFDRIKAALKKEKEDPPVICRTNKEIADAIGSTEGAIKSALHLKTKSGTVVNGYTIRPIFLLSFSEKEVKTVKSKSKPKQIEDHKDSFLANLVKK